MSTRVNPELVEELSAYGAEDVQKCFNCGNCTATCSLAEEHENFPRRSMRALQLGMEDRLKGGLEPWLCYYCGECSTLCPRGAQPGETMMSLRRWLTSRYDFTGISRLFYRRPRVEVVSVIVVALLTALGFSLFGFLRGNIHEYNGANSFLPAATIHIFDWSLAGVLLALLIPNIFRMWWFTVGRETMGRSRAMRVPAAAYLRSVYLFPLHFITQKRYAQCERRRPWLVHLALMLSYVTMLVLIMFFLKYMWAATIDWRVHVFGYLASAGLIFATVWAIIGRLKKMEAQHQHSHESDWIFLILLLVVALTGVAQHVLHRSGADAAANVAYVVHLMGVVPMLGLEVPFSKWSHMAYRPLAMYFATLRKHMVPAPIPEQVAGGMQTELVS
ncbi:MAG: 4Fe-4S dicluster domain-containing protein [Actinobacteria bacterium]|nr:4Fe-4S dicluster domain-containing protein [Actinomycetota bacterium]